MEKKKKKKPAGHPWLMPIILASQEAEISRIKVQSQPRHSSPEPISALSSNPSTTKKKKKKSVLN
jgi:hypothetical protein